MKIKRILAAVCAVTLASSAVGCSSIKPTEADTAAVKSALEKFYSCESFTVVQVTDSTEVATTDGVEYSYVANNVKEISLITAPSVQMKASTEIKVTAEEGVMEQSSASYIIPENGGYTEYFSDGAAWHKISTNDADAMAGINARAFASAFYVDDLAFGKAGEETLDGGKSVRYEAEIGGADLVTMLESIGYFNNSIGSMSENQQAKIKENLVKDLSPVAVCVWVDEADGYPVRFEVSMTGMLKDLEKSISKTLGNRDSGDWSITEYEISMTVKDFNAVTEIVLPPEAADAEPYVFEDSLQA